ncbi:ferredoxin [Sphingomonadaceae bacterium G21617-S1]|jgi:hypothetical protein|nr:ferredoxin [Sphingomonadaceae bacterium G21617-S1]
MNPFAGMDPTIEEYVKANGSTLFTEWAGEPARFFHLPGHPPFECFQVSINPPRAGRVAVFARSIDTNDGSELEESWEAPVQELSSLLVKATRAVQVWRNRLQQNLPPSDGDFYVEPGCCLLCGVPEDIAPEIFETGKNHCFVKRQPCLPDEIDRTLKAMWSSEVDCIRYRGHDAVLLERLARAGMADQADYPLRLDAPAGLRNRVSFGISTESSLSTSPALIASVFRADMVASGKTVLPAMFGRKTVWVSWFQNRFHLVRFTDEGAGRFAARLRSSIALQGLAWLVDDWLRTKNVENIHWEATGDPLSGSPTLM